MKTYKFILIFTSFLFIFSFGLTQKNRFFLEWKRFYKITYGEIYEFKLKYVFNEDKIGFYKIYIGLKGETTYKRTLDVKESNFNVIKGVKTKINFATCAYFTRLTKTIYLKYKIMKKQNKKLVPTGKILEVKKTQILPSKRISAWRMFCSP